MSLANLFNFDGRFFQLPGFESVAAPVSLKCVSVSVTRLGVLLHFGQLFKDCGNNYFAQIAHILGNLCKCVEVFHFSSEIIFGQLF